MAIKIAGREKALLEDINVLVTAIMKMVIIFQKAEVFCLMPTWFKNIYKYDIYNWFPSFQGTLIKWALWFFSKVLHWKSLFFSCISWSDHFCIYWPGSSTFNLFISFNKYIYISHSGLSTRSSLFLHLLIRICVAFGNVELTGSSFQGRPGGKRRIHLGYKDNLHPKPLVMFYLAPARSIRILKEAILAITQLPWSYIL